MIQNTFTASAGRAQHRIIKVYKRYVYSYWDIYILYLPFCSKSKHLHFAHLLESKQDAAIEQR